MSFVESETHEIKHQDYGQSSVCKESRKPREKQNEAVPGQSSEWNRYEIHSRISHAPERFQVPPIENVRNL